jgi:hypothetical protein
MASHMAGRLEVPSKVLLVNRLFHRLHYALKPFNVAQDSIEGCIDHVDFITEAPD